MKEKIVSASILALSIVILGICLKSGIDNFVNKDNTVTVKGLAEKEVCWIMASLKMKSVSMLRL